MQHEVGLRCSPVDGSPVTCATHGGRWANGACQSREVLQDVLDERARQFAQYGTNAGLEDGTGPSSRWLEPITTMDARLTESFLRSNYVRHEARTGRPTWMHLLREEMAEVFTEDDPARLREELLQVAALAVSWIEKLDAR